MNKEKSFRLGVVEGFFGLPWSWDARREYASFLSQNDCNSYLYAPKSDSYLRKSWFEPFPTEHKQSLEDLSWHYRQEKIDFGIGLSPYELYKDFSSDNKELLEKKIEELNAIAPDTLCVLFDDMHGDFDSLAKAQTEIMNFISERSSASNFIFCPTYYSHDPLLAKHFGAAPRDYLQSLGTLLDPEIDIFWTGPKIFSEQYTPAHLQEMAEVFQRQVLIWDNYPVNDSKALSSFLHLQPKNGEHNQLTGQAAGHMANPMNQAYLSQLPLYGLAQLYRKGEAKTKEEVNIFEEACFTLCPEDLAQALISDANILQSIGLKGLSEEQKDQLKIRYFELEPNPMAREIVDWLDDKYEFDPACLN